MEAWCGRRSHDDVLGNFAESQVVVDGRPDKVGAVDDALFQGRINLAARQEDRGHTGGPVDVGDDPPGITDFFALEVLKGSDGDFGVDQVVIVLDRAYLIHVVLAVGLPGDFLSSQSVIPGLPLVRTIQCKWIGGEKGRNRDFPGPVDVKAVHGVEDPCLDGVKHLEGAHDGTGRKSFDDQFPFGHIADIFAEFLEFDVAKGSRVPSGLNLELDGLRR